LRILFFFLGQRVHRNIFSSSARQEVLQGLQAACGGLFAFYDLVFPGLELLKVSRVDDLPIFR